MFTDARGVTLIELMTAIAVLALLMGIGVPAFTSIVRSNQIAAESNNLVAAFSLARSEALKRGKRVSVCAANGNVCAGAASWGNGWLVFEDDFGAAGVLEASDELLQKWSGPANGVEIGADAAAVTFARSGRAEFARTFTITKSGCTNQQAREVQIALSGRIALTRIECPDDDEE